MPNLSVNLFCLATISSPASSSVRRCRFFVVYVVILLVDFLLPFISFFFWLITAIACSNSPARSSSCYDSHENFFSKRYSPFLCICSLFFLLDILVLFAVFSPQSVLFLSSPPFLFLIKVLKLYATSFMTTALKNSTLL